MPAEVDANEVRTDSTDGYCEMFLQAKTPNAECKQGVMVIFEKLRDEMESNRTSKNEVVFCSSEQLGNFSFTFEDVQRELDAARESYLAQGTDSECPRISIEPSKK